MSKLMASFNRSLPQPQIATPQGLEDYTILQWMLVFAPKHVFLKKVIDLVADRVLQWQNDVASDSMQSSLCPHVKTIVLTGPIAYTTAICDVGAGRGGWATKKEMEKEENKGEDGEHNYWLLGFDYEGSLRVASTWT